MLPFEESSCRIENVRRLLRSRSLDCLLVYYDELAIANGYYLSGWCPQFESGMILVPIEGTPMILGGAESEPFAHTDSAIRETRNISSFMVPEEEYPNATITDFRHVLGEISRGHRTLRVGLVGMNQVPLGIYTDLRRQAPGVEFADLTREYEMLRKRKSPFELEQIQRAFELGDRAFEEVRRRLHPGQTEFEIAAIAEFEGRRRGAGGFGFQTIVASGERSNGCVPTASAHVLADGDLLLFGCSFRYNGYCCAAGNTFVVGDAPTAAQAQVLSDLAEAFLRTRDALRIGARGRDIDAPARQLFEQNGYSKYLICPFAHSIGLREAEAPFFGPGSDDRLEEDMAVCIDVSLFNHPVFHGVRIETGYRITRDGPVAFSPMLEEYFLGLRR